MKKILMALAALPLVAGMWNCAKEDIVFSHEKPQFETREGAILLEVIVPLGTDASRETVYMAGPVTGFDAESVVDQPMWALTPSANIHKWGIYVDPADFAQGKTLADGYYFVSSLNGREKSLNNEDVTHTQTAKVGERINNVSVVRWASYFLPPPEVEWPAVAQDRIQLRITLPESTPDGYNVGVVGEFNGWYGAKDKWLATQLKGRYYYIDIDPAAISAGKSLADKFFVCLFDETHDWWYFQNNEDGTSEEGPGLTIANTQPGKYYEIKVTNWRNSADLPAGIPEPGKEQFLLKIRVPDYTPANSLIGIFGDWNGWDAMLSDKEKWTATMWPSGIYSILINTAGLDLTKMFHVTLYYETSTAGNWWKHQMNLDGSGDEGPGINNAEKPASPKITITGGGTYIIDVPEWRNSEDIKSAGKDPEDVSVNPWNGLTVEQGKILLQIEVPGGTPDNSLIALCGTASGWGKGVENDAFHATYYNPGRYYIQLDPAAFEDGTTLADEFRFGLLTASSTADDWWAHESNAFKIKGTEAGKAYTVVVTGWRDTGNFPNYIAYPDIPADKYVIHLFVPANTPDNADIALYGDVNGWKGSDSKWHATKVGDRRYVLELDPADFASDSGLTKETTANGFSFAVIAEGQDWYYHQNEGGNLLLPNGAAVGNPYGVTVDAWKNESDL